MPETNVLLLFAVATLTLNVTPGPDMLYVVALLASFAGLSFKSRVGDAAALSWLTGAH